MLSPHSGGGGGGGGAVCVCACCGDATRCCFLAGLFLEGSGSAIPTGIPNPQRYSSMRFLRARFVVR